MNVFVLSTGRCGSTTFARACSHIRNYSAAHESRIETLENRVEYPENHIEVDNRLSWFLGRLDARYGDEAFYVHLRRDREATAESFLRRYDSGILAAYRRWIVPMMGEEPDPLDVCRHYYDTVNANIELFLKDKPKCMEFQLETAEEDFRAFWNRIEATGGVSMAVCEWQRQYNASTPGKDRSRRWSTLVRGG
jgi:hypothetical protein